AISASWSRHGRASCLRAESAAAIASSCDSRRGLHRQRRLQRIPHSKTRHPFRRPILREQQHRVDVCLGSSRRRTLRLLRCFSPFLLGRATFLATSQTFGSAEITRHGSLSLARRSLAKEDGEGGSNCVIVWRLESHRQF